MTAAVVLISGIRWFGVKQHRCKQPDAAFARKIEAIKHDAHDELKIGTKQADVARFFAEHSIPLTIVDSEAIGTLHTFGGCAPLGCGTNSALIGVRVKLDGTGSVAEEPKVVAMYTDCL